MLPSNYEIFGMVLLEANYFNLPIVSSFNGGSISIIQDTYDGYIVDNFNVNEWVEKILLLFENEKKLKNFSNSWNDRANHFINIYKNVTGK